MQLQHADCLHSDPMFDVLFLDSIGIFYILSRYFLQGCEGDGNDSQG
jgi:hypothetical protein